MSAAQSGSGSTEWPIFYAKEAGTKLESVNFVPVSAITSVAVGAVANLNLYRNNVQLLGDGLLGMLSFVGTGGTSTCAVAYTPQAFQLGQFVWTSTLYAAVTGASSTSGRVNVAGQSLLTTVIPVGVAVTLVVEPGTTRQETIVTTSGGLNTSTGAFTLTGTTKFANSHQIGVPVVISAPYTWAGTTAATTANTSTSAVLTAQAPSTTSANITNASTLIFDPGLTTQEILTPGQFTISTGTVTIAATYGVAGHLGTFEQTHGSGGTVVVSGNALPLQVGDIVTMKWAQQSTGIALPVTMIQMDYSIY